MLHNLSKANSYFIDHGRENAQTSALITIFYLFFIWCLLLLGARCGAHTSALLWSMVIPFNQEKLVTNTYKHLPFMLKFVLSFEMHLNLIKRWCTTLKSLGTTQVFKMSRFKISPKKTIIICFLIFVFVSALLIASLVLIYLDRQ